MPKTNYDEGVAISDSTPLDNGSGQARAKQSPSSTQRTHKLVIGLSLYAALRILFFAAAFPLTNNIDERFHLMTIQMYAQGHTPGKELPQMDPELARAFLPYWSPEYGHSQEELNREGASRPLYKLTPQVQDSALAQEFYASQLKR